MIKKLIEKYEIRKEMRLIRKHFRTAKRHKSSSELENVKFELLDFQGRLVENNKLNDYMSMVILNFFAEINYFKINQINSTDFEC